MWRGPESIRDDQLCVTSCSADLWRRSLLCSAACINTGENQYLLDACGVLRALPCGRMVVLWALQHVIALRSVTTVVTGSDDDYSKQALHINNNGVYAAVVNPLFRPITFITPTVRSSFSFEV